MQRVSALETDMSKQAQAMGELREYSQRTEDNLSRLISGVGTNCPRIAEETGGAGSRRAGPRRSQSLS